MQIRKLSTVPPWHKNNTFRKQKLHCSIRGASDCNCKFDTLPDLNKDQESKVIQQVRCFLDGWQGLRHTHWSILMLKRYSDHQFLYPKASTMSYEWEPHHTWALYQFWDSAGLMPLLLIQITKLLWQITSSYRLTKSLNCKVKRKPAMTSTVKTSCCRWLVFRDHSVQKGGPTSLGGGKAAGP